MRACLYLSGIVLSLNAATAAACGYCIEDKIAAVYDHTIVTQALDRKHHVAFFAITGNFAPDQGTRRAIEIIVESSKGVDKGSAKVSIESASLSLAFDPKRETLTTLQQAVAQKLAIKKLSLQPLRIIEQNGKMLTVDENSEKK